MNRITSAIRLFFLFAILLIGKQANSQTINNWGVVGSATPNGWGGPDIPLSYNAGLNTWSAVVTLINGEIKFRNNNDWALNYGDNGADGTLDAGGSNIVVAAGTYLITLDFTTLNYSISQTKAYYVNDNFPAGDLFTSAVGNDINTGTKAAPFATITYALSQAAAGDTIYVDAGTYVEQVTIYKGVVIKGAGQNLTSILKPAVTNDPPAVPPSTFAERGVIQTAQSILGDVHISDLSVTGDYTLNVTPIIIQSGGSVRNCTLQSGNQGIFVRIDPAIIPVAKTFVVDGNTINAEYIAVNFAGSSRLTATLSNNTLATFNPGFSTGVFAGTDFGTLTRLTVTGNIFSSYVTDGLFVNTNNGIISQNSFLGTGAKAINKFGGSTINATCNWYGSADVNVLALKITPGVTFSPWLVNGTDNSAAIGFQPVPNTCTGKQTRYYVFNNTSGTRLFTTGVGNDANPGIASSPMATITGAYQKAQTGDTIIVDAGTYDLGGLTYTFPKSVTFLGTNYLVSPNDAADKLQPNTSRNAESIINNFTFLITSNDLSFEGFTIDPGNRTLLSLSNAAFGRLKFRRNHVRISSSVSVFNLSGVVATDPALLTSSDYLFDDNRFNRSASGSGITFSLNYLKNVVLSNNSGVISGPTTRAQIFAAVGQSGVVDSLSLTGNVIDRANYNLFTSLASRLYVTGNKFYNAARGLFIQTTVSGSSEVLVENNEIVHNLPGTVINSIISCNRFNGNSAATNVARIRNNNITIDATGLSFVPSAISGFNAGTLVNPVLEISGNKITHSGNFSSLTSIFNAISVTGNLLNASITANELVNSGTNYLLTPINSSASTSSGIQMSTDAGINSVTAAAVININNNKVSGYKQSVIFYDFSTTAPNTYTGYGNLPAGVTVNINNNSFANDSISINNGTVGQPVLATCNWYGSADAAVVVPKLSANVNYSPWLSNGTDNDVATGFQPVPNSCNGRQNKFYVNDADITGDVFTTKIGDDANSGIPSAPLLTINAAITKASAGDTIFVDAGTYNLASPLTINKSITILGSNYLVSPNDATTKTIYNSSRNAEARITGAALVIGADYINLKGLRFSPTSGAVSQNGNFSHIKIEKNYFDVIGTGNIINLQGSTSNPIVAFDFAITDNRFERTDLLTGRSINLGLVKNVWIDNNLFIETPASGNPYRGFALRTESNQRVESTVFSNNYVKKLQVGVLPTMIQDWTINNNVFDSCTTGINHIPANMVSTNVFIRSNTFTNMRVGRSILVRGGTNGGVSNYNITDNTHNQEVDGINGIVGMIQLDFNAPNTFGTVSVMRNKLNLGGNYQNTVIETNCGIFLVGEHTNTTIADNELSFSAINARTHTFGVMPPVPTGVFINTDNLTSSSGVTGPVITISNNKIHGFKSSIGLYDPTATGATPSIGYGYLNNAATVTIINNSFTGDSMSIDNGTTSKFVLSTCNWYGSAAAQDFISKLSLATVEVIPWLTNGTDNDAATGFQPVSGSCDGYPTLITLNSSTNVTCNGAANGSIAITTSYGKAPFTYTWTKEGDANFVSHDEDPTGLAPGTYTLSILDGNGSNIYITDPEADGPGVITVVITEPDVLTASATGSNNICFNGAIGSASVTASGGTAPYTYLWSNGATTEEISNLTAGVYIVTVTDDHGCTATASYEVTQPTLLTASINNSSTACSNIATVTAGSGTPGYSYLWSNGSTSATISGVPAGTYSVTVTDANGCTATASVNLTVAEAFNPSASVTNVTCFGANNGVITVTNANGTAPFMFSKDGGVTFVPGTLPFSFTNLAPGSYNIAVKDVNGCTGFVSRTVSQPTALTPTISSVVSSCFGQSTGAVTVTVTGGVPAYTYSWTREGGGFSSSQLNISGVAAGNYTLTVTDKNGCTAVLPVTVPSNNQILVNEAITNVLCRNTATGSINLTVTGGTGAGFTYSWTGAVISSNEDLNNIGAANNYNVRITDIGSGCFVDRSYQVTQPAALTISTTGTNATGCNSLGTITATAGGGVGNYQYSINGGSYQTSNVFTGLYAGTYTVTVRDGNGCTTNAAARSITDNGGDQYESNNSRTNSKPISIGTTINARLALATDVADWFVITTPAGGTSATYSLVITHPTPGISYTFDLYPASPNNAIALTPAGVIGTTRKDYTLNPGTSYRIGVTTATLSYICYSLSVSPLVPVTSSNNYVKPQLETSPILVTDVLRAGVYPNPHRGSFTLRIESPEEGAGSVEMYNASGQMIGERKVNLMKGKGNLVQYYNMNQAVLFYRVRIGKHVVNGKIIGLQ